MGIPQSRAGQPRFAWSESRHRRFLECRRKHFLAVYQAHGGWHPSASVEQRHAWTMAKLIPGWPVALGNVVHRCATSYAVRCATHQPLPTFATMHRAARRELNRVYQCSRDRLADFLRAPSEWPVLDSRFYGEPWRPEDFDRTRLALTAALEALLSASELWQTLRKAGPEGLWIPERFHAFRLMPTGTHIFAAPDLVVREHPHAQTEIWDFKVGRGDGVVDQVLVYALALQHTARFPPVEDPDARYLGRVVHLSAAATPDARASFPISDVDLAGSRQRIAESVSQMQAGLRDVAQNIPDTLTHFPQTAHASRCIRCQFRGICYPDRFPVSSSPIHADGTR